MAVNLSKIGISSVRRALKAQGLTYMKLAERSYVSHGTIKRFIKGTPVSLSTFHSICEALDLDPNQLIAKTDDIDSTRVPKDQLDTDPLGAPKTHPIKGSVAVVGVFTEDKQRQIRVALDMLERLLVEGGDIIITMDEDEDID